MSGTVLFKHKTNSKNPRLAFAIFPLESRYSMSLLAISQGERGDSLTSSRHLKQKIIILNFSPLLHIPTPHELIMHEIHRVKVHHIITNFSKIEISQRIFFILNAISHNPPSFFYLRTLPLLVREPISTLAAAKKKENWRILKIAELANWPGDLSEINNNSIINNENLEIYAMGKSSIHTFCLQPLPRNTPFFLILIFFSLFFPTLPYPSYLNCERERCGKTYFSIPNPLNPVLVPQLWLMCHSNLMAQHDRSSMIYQI